MNVLDSLKFEKHPGHQPPDIASVLSKLSASNYFNNLSPGMMSEHLRLQMMKCDKCQRRSPDKLICTFVDPNGQRGAIYECPNGHKYTVYFKDRIDD